MALYRPCSTSRLHAYWLPTAYKDSRMSFEPPNVQPVSMIGRFSAIGQDARRGSIYRARLNSVEVEPSLRRHTTRRGLPNTGECIHVAREPGRLAPRPYPQSAAAELLAYPFMPVHTVGLPSPHRPHLFPRHASGAGGAPACAPPLATGSLRYSIAPGTSCPSQEPHTGGAGTPRRRSAERGRAAIGPAPSWWRGRRHRRIH